MAWTAEDTFESYSDGASLNGGSGGSGWTNNWATAGSTWLASTASAFEGSKSARTTTGYMQRNFTAISSGTVTLYWAAMRTTNTNASRFYVVNNAQSSGIGIQFTGGNIQVDGATSTTIVTGYTTSQWYAFKIVINKDAWTADIYYSTVAYGGTESWTTGVTGKTLFGTANNLDLVRHECDSLGAGNYYYSDNISPTSPYETAATSWTATENFDSYSNGDSLDTKNGGSGWAAAWAQQEASIGVTNAQSGSGSLSITGTGAYGNGRCTRQLTTPITGTSTIIHFMLRTGTFGGGASNHYAAVSLDNDNAYTGYLQTFISPGGQQGNVIQLNAGGQTVPILSSPLTDTWYHVYVDYDITNKRMRGYASTTIPHAVPTWSAYTNARPGPAPTGAYLNVHFLNENNLTTHFWIDDIRGVGSDFDAVSVPSLTLLNCGA